MQNVLNGTVRSNQQGDWRQVRRLKMSHQSCYRCIRNQSLRQERGKNTENCSQRMQFFGRKRDSAQVPEHCKKQ